MRKLVCGLAVLLFSILSVSPARAANGPTRHLDMMFVTVQGVTSSSSKDEGNTRAPRGQLFVKVHMLVVNHNDIPSAIIGGFCVNVQSQVQGAQSGNSITITNTQMYCQDIGNGGSATLLPAHSMHVMQQYVLPIAHAKAWLVWTLGPNSHGCGYNSYPPLCTVQWPISY